jgi:hypothetical protein
MPTRPNVTVANASTARPYPNIRYVLARLRMLPGPRRETLLEVVHRPIMTITLRDRHPSRPALRARLARWMRGPTFARDIAIVLAIKFALLMVLKYAFFNHPQADNMSMPPALVAQALLSVPAPHSSQGDQHAR